MATAYELRARTLGFDWKNGVRISRRFRVDVPPHQVPLDGSIPGLPAKNEPHPFYPSAIVDEIMPEEFDGRSNWSVVDVVYSTGRQYGFPTKPLDPTREDFKSWSMSFRTAELFVPVAKKVLRTVASPNGDPPAQVEMWSYGPDVGLTIHETRVIVSRRVVLLDIGPSVWVPIMEQNNKIHVLPDGLPYRFEAGDIVQTSETAWQTVYSWHGDTGTFAPQLLNQSPVTAGDIIYPPGFASSAYVRLPHSTWQTLHNTAVANGPPTFQYTELYDDSEPSGWASLPGDPI